MSLPQPCRKLPHPQTSEFNDERSDTIRGTNGYSIYFVDQLVCGSGRFV